MSAHRTLNDLFRAFDSVGPGRIKDPGDAGTITVKQWGQVCGVTTAGAETRILAAPTKPGIVCAVVLDVYVGALTLTVKPASGTCYGYNADNDTTIVFGTAGDFVVFYSIEIGTEYVWRVLGQEGTDSSVVSGVFGTVSIASILATNISAGTGLTALAASIGSVSIGASNITALTGVFKSINVSTGMTAPLGTINQLVATSKIEANSILATNISVGAASVTGNRVLGVGTIQVSGGTAAVDTQATALLTPTLNVISVGTATNNYFKLPAAAKGIVCNVVNLGSTAGILGATAGVSIASATSVALATANATGSALNLVCDGTNWWHRAL